MSGDYRPGLQNEDSRRLGGLRQYKVADISKVRLGIVVKGQLLGNRGWTGMGSFPPAACCRRDWPATGGLGAGSGLWLFRSVRRLQVIIPARDAIANEACDELQFTVALPETPFAEFAFPSLLGQSLGCRRMMPARPLQAWRNSGCPSS